MSVSRTRVVDDGDLRTYRIELPNMLDDSELDPYEFRLYAHLKRRAGDSGYCDEGARKIAKVCKMSLGKVVESKRSLAEKGFIKVTAGDPATSTPDTIHIVNVWTDNFSRYAPRSQDEQAVHNTNTPVHEQPPTRSPDEHPCSPHERKKEPREEVTKKEETKEVGSRASARSPDTKKMSDDEFVEYLKAEPAYSHINIETEAGKMRKWCAVRNKQPTRRRFINWLNNVEPPMNEGSRNGATNTNRGAPRAGKERLTDNARRTAEYFGLGGETEGSG